MRTILRLIVPCFALFAAAPSLANEQPVYEWLAAFRQEALQNGIRPDVVEAAFRDFEPIDRVISLDRKQPESTQTIQEYLRKVITQSRIDRARAEFAANREVLTKIGQHYGVQPQYIVALWAIESNFGERMGDFDVVHSLATLAYDGRRSAYFRKELLNALRIVNEGHISLDEMKGSWAGAMGQCQFMPTSFLHYAVDANADGRKDIWNDELDVFASIANYLHTEGWNPRKGWGTKKKPADNFNVILHWNRSRYFATAVGTLADYIVKEPR